MFSEQNCREYFVQDNIRNLESIFLVICRPRVDQGKATSLRLSILINFPHISEYCKSAFRPTYYKFIKVIFITNKKD